MDVTERFFFCAWSKENEDEMPLSPKNFSCPRVSLHGEFSLSCPIYSVVANLCGRYRWQRSGVVVLSLSLRTFPLPCTPPGRMRRGRAQSARSESVRRMVSSCSNIIRTVSKGRCKKCTPRQKPKRTETSNAWGTVKLKFFYCHYLKYY